MTYHMTVEKTVRCSFSFEAENDRSAEIEAERLCNEFKNNEFEIEDEEFDYALCDEEGNDIICWR